MPIDNPYVDALAGTSWWEAGRDNIITYHMAADFGAGWTAHELDAFSAAFRAFEAVCDVRFVESSRASADIIENKLTAEEALSARPHEHVWSAWHDYPEAGQTYGFYDYTRDFWPGSLAPGGKAFWLILHEIGHALGLDHPNTTTQGTGLFPGVAHGDPDDPGTFGLNHSLMTIVSNRLTLSASSAIGQVSGPMAFDIAALQEMYGAVPAETGNNTYKLGANHWRCIWDTGGTDTFVFENGRDAIIDLRAATLRVEPGGGGWLSYAEGINGGFTIANNVTIENARGGSGDDIITGNSADNLLDGQKGDDRLTAGDGEDRLYGYSGNDVLRCGSGNDFAAGGSGNDRLEGAIGADILVGGAGADTIYLGLDGDRDVVAAGQGDRIYQFDSGEDKIDLTAFDADWVWFGKQGGKWVVTVDYDNDPSFEVELLVHGDGLRMSDFIL